jgi:hypothetical protein
MNKIIDFIKQHKKIVLGVAGGLLVVIIAIILIITLTKPKKTNKEQLTSSLEALGRKYYEEFYYPQVANSDDVAQKKEFLQNFSTIGFRITLDSLLRYNDGLENKDNTEYKNKKKNEDCDKKKTMVIIYPKDEYGAKDYDIKVELVCGFDN